MFLHIFIILRDDSYYPSDDRVNNEIQKVQDMELAFIFLESFKNFLI